MARLTHRPPLLEIAVVVAAPALAVAFQGAAPSNFDDDSSRDPSVRRMFSSMAILLLSGLVVLIFSIGAYLLIRIGRAVAQKPPPAGPTEYVDAWSRYRVSEAEMDAAMRDLKDSHGASDPEPPDDSLDEPFDDIDPPKKK